MQLYLQPGCDFLAETFGERTARQILSPKSEQLNDLVAPVTRAYSEPEIINVKIEPGDIKDDAAEFALIIRCKRNPTGWPEGIRVGRDPLMGPT